MNELAVVHLHQENPDRYTWLGEVNGMFFCKICIC